MKEVIIKAAKLGGAELNKYFKKTTEVFEKSMVADFRTEADLASEKAILFELQKHFPDYNYYAEESGWIKNGSEYTFIIDPLDGTNNFSLGMPSFSVSIGLIKNKEIICGAIYNPVLDEVYYAEKGKGSFMNDLPIKTSNITDIQNATISYTCGYINDSSMYENLVKETGKLKLKRLLTNWSPALDYCLLASGRIEAVICNKNDVYDNVAGKLIVKEAGGVVSEFDGGEEKDETSTSFVASNNEELHKRVIEIVRSIGL